MLTGRVKITTNGRMMALIKPITNAVISADQKLVTLTPGIKYAASMTASAFTTQRRINIKFKLIIKNLQLTIFESITDYFCNNCYLLIVHY